MFNSCWINNINTFSPIVLFIAESHNFFLMFTNLNFPEKGQKSNNNSFDIKCDFISLWFDIAEKCMHQRGQYEEHATTKEYAFEVSNIVSTNAVKMFGAKMLQKKITLL